MDDCDAIGGALLQIERAFARRRTGDRCLGTNTSVAGTNSFAAGGRRIAPGLSCIRRELAHGDSSLMPTLLVGERERRLYPLDPEKIDYIESDGNYVSIRSANAAYISRDTIKRLADELAPHGFIRIERSLLVNIRAVLYAETIGRGRFAFTLSSGVCLQSSSSYREAILRALPLASSLSRRSPH
jgi:DNA-binding LytR/AlgR family response regulator